MDHKILSAERCIAEAEDDDDDDDAVVVGVRTAQAPSFELLIVDVDEITSFSAADSGCIKDADGDLLEDIAISLECVIIDGVGVVLLD